MGCVTLGRAEEDFRVFAKLSTNWMPIGPHLRLGGIRPHHACGNYSAAVSARAGNDWLLFSVSLTAPKMEKGSPCLEYSGGTGGARLPSMSLSCRIVRCSCVFGVLNIGRPIHLNCIVYCYLFGSRDLPGSVRTIEVLHRYPGCPAAYFMIAPIVAYEQCATM